MGYLSTASGTAAGGTIRQRMEKYHAIIREAAEETAKIEALTTLTESEKKDALDAIETMKEERVNAL
jgi:hypothetical protein